MPTCRLCQTEYVPDTEKIPGLPFEINIWRCPKCKKVKNVVGQQEYDAWESAYKNSKDCSCNKGEDCCKKKVNKDLETYYDNGCGSCPDCDKD